MDVVLTDIREPVHLLNKHNAHARTRAVAYSALTSSEPNGPSNSTAQVPAVNGTGTNTVPTDTRIPAASFLPWLSSF